MEQKIAVFNKKFKTGQRRIILIVILLAILALMWGSFCIYAVHNYRPHKALPTAQDSVSSPFDPSLYYLPLNYSDSENNCRN